MTLLPRPFVLRPRNVDNLPVLGNELGEVTEFPPVVKSPMYKDDMDQLLSIFSARGRKTQLSCPLRNQRKTRLDICIHTCENKCRKYSIKNLMEKNENRTRFLDDWIKLQRLVNLAYGTAQKKIVETDEED